MALQFSNTPTSLVIPSASVMERIPIEIIAAIGHFLDGPTVYSAIQVCHQWYSILRPFLWTSISISQWQHHQFPLHNNDHPIFAWQQQLRRVQRFEWCCNPSTIRDATKKHRKATAAIDIDELRKRRKPFLRSVKMSRLFLILQYCTNLTSLSIRKLNARIEDLNLLRGLVQLQRLRQLELDIRGKFDEAYMAIEDMFPLFEQLDELILAGSGFSIRGNDDEDEDANTTTELEIPRSWKLSRLSISPSAMTLVRHCPDLRTLELRLLDSWQEYQSEIYQSIRPIMISTRLTELNLCLSHRQRNLTDVVEILSSFKELQSLSFNPLLFEQISFLSTRQSNDGDGNDSGNGDMVLPLLEHLELHLDHLQSNSLAVNNALRDVLKTRPRLKSFVVRKYPIYATDIFARPGLENQDGWACLDLERFHVHMPMLRNLRLEDDQIALSHMIYRQLGLLSKLKHVSITCMEIKHGTNSGIDLLAGASGLESLVLMDYRNAPWTKEEVFRVLQMFPKLSQLHVEPGSKAIALACAQELDRDIRIEPRNEFL
ncbi:hypothetical protein BGZ51_005843 [Haplosporangium sp. Z 767]|nr:hypothetical protein BGZ51_005843 [Haplosporangium sp. Z 767]KAF9194588.1 hypothetical protein BGZ50_006101 [Haplosporangium sp. Z 11]